MANVQITEVEGLSVAAITHAQLSTIPSTATVAEAGAYFAASSSRRSAFVVDDNGRYLGSLTPDDLPSDGDPSTPVLKLARIGATTSPDDPAAVGRDLALAAESRRIPVIDADRRLLGVVAVNRTGEWFCGTG